MSVKTIRIRVQEACSSRGYKKKKASRTLAWLSRVLDSLLPAARVVKTLKFWKLGWPHRSIGLLQAVIDHSANLFSASASSTELNQLNPG